VIGATNRPDDLDEALRRPGRFVVVKRHKRVLSFCCLLNI
jgi:SpoVK/Ycf46/Vps4 family AAA+-type ATPase